MKYTFKMVLISTLLAVATGAQAHGKAPEQSVQKTASKTPARAQGIWIDVRSAEEYAQGHLKDAVNVPHDQIAQRIAELESNKNAPINLYCRSGRRAELALQELKKMGYTHVVNHGGYEDLIKKGIQ